MSLHHLVTLSLLICLTACATPAPPSLTAPRLTATISVPGSTPRPSETGSPAPQPTATESVAPTTPPKPHIIFITLGGEQATAFQTVISRAAMEFGWEAQQVQADAPNVVETAAQAGASVIVLDGPQLSEQALIIAGRYPQTYFIALHPVAGDLPANLVAFTEARTDQAAFLAGMAAGFATAKKYVVVIGDPTTSEGLKSTNGFLHGARYACPKCRVETVAVTGDLEKDKASVVIYANSGADVFFAAAGVPDELMLRATESEAWVIGWGGDVYMTAFESGNHPGAELVLTSVFLDPSTALYTALTAYHAGAPLTGAHPPSAANGAVGIALYRSPSDALSPFDKQAIETALNQLADGSLDPGIDPVTGEEK